MRYRIFLQPRRSLKHHAQWRVVRLDTLLERLSHQKPEQALSWWYTLCEGIATRPGKPTLSALDTREIVQHFYAPRGDAGLNRFRRRLWARYGESWDQFDAVVSHLQAATNAASQESVVHLSPVEKQRADILWQLMGRAGLVAGEVATLGRAGYSDGANARVRTLLEIAVTGDLLCVAHEETLVHYRAQHLFSMRKAARSQADHVLDLFGEAAQDDANFAARRVDELDREIEELTASGLIPGRSQRGGTYWWARAEIARRTNPSSGAVGFDSALAVTPLARFKPFYYLFNTPTHAGADALAALLVDRSLDPADQEKIFLTGPSDDGPLDALQIALACLQDLARSIMISLDSAEGGTSIDGRLGFLLDVIDSVVETIIDTMHQRRPENDGGHAWNRLPPHDEQS